ncbi:MAG: accessory factor UbiK family protein [Oceanicoccus sp.]
MQSTNELVDSLVEKVSGLFNSAGDASTIKAEIKNNLRAVVQSTVSKLDMVSRDEFDAQVEVLYRSREKIDLLEQQLAEISASINRADQDKPSR